MIGLTGDDDAMVSIEKDWLGVMAGLGWLRGGTGWLVRFLRA